MIKKPFLSLKVETRWVAKLYGGTRPDLPTLHLWEKERFIKTKNKKQKTKNKTQNKDL